MQIIKIKDQYYTVNDGVTLSDADIKKLQSLPEPNVKMALNTTHPGLDFAQSRNLQSEIIQPYTPTTTSFKNELSDNTDYKNQVKQSEKSNNLTYIFADYTIPDQFIPDNLQQSGLQISRSPEFYRIKYDDQSKKCITTDAKGNAINFHSTRASRSSSGITIYDKAFGFDQESMDIIKKVEALLQNQPTGQTAVQAYKALPNKDREIYANYRHYKAHYLDPNQKFYSLSHEMHHERNAQLLKQRQADHNSGNLSIEDHFRLLENDEKSAHIAETLEGIRQYYLSNQNLQVFPEKCKWLIKDLKNLTSAERDAKLQDMSYIVNGTIENWDKNYAAAYRGKNQQFNDQLLNIAWDRPSHKLQEDHNEYLLQRSLTFTLPVYNKDTKQKEFKDLSAFIKQDVEITTEIDNNYMDAVRNIVKTRTERLNNQNITPDILRQINAGTLPENFIVPEPKKITINQNIPNPPPPAPQNGDFKDVYRQFYAQKAKIEKSKYTEDAKSPYYQASLQRQNGEELNITATSADHVILAAKDKNKKSKVPDYADFKDIVKLAQQQGRAISFGNITTPEYKARLLLACLEGGVVIQNMPSFNELKDIEPQTKQLLAAQRIQLLRRTIQDKESNGQYSGLDDVSKSQHEKIEAARDVIRKTRKSGSPQTTPEYKNAIALIKARQKALGGK